MNVKRTMQLMWNDVCMQKKIIVLATLGIGFLFVLFGKMNNLSSYAELLNLGGILITSYAFADLHQNKRGYAYLMLPASAFEKFFSRWFLTGVGYALYSLLAYGLLSFIAPHKAVFSVFSKDVVPLIMQYLVIQSVVFLGAIYFKRYRLLKTALAVGVLIFMLFASLSLLFYLLNPADAAASSIYVMNSISQGPHYIIWGLLASFCLLTAYVRFREYEI